MYGLCSKYVFVAKSVICYSFFTQHDTRYVIVSTAEMKNENVDCEVYKKPSVKTFTSQDTGKLLRSNHNDLLGGGGGR